MGILAFNIPMAKADDIPGLLTLELPTITDAFAVPGTEVDIPVTVVDGYTNPVGTDDQIVTISIHIEYDSEVVRPRGTSSDDIIVDFDTFGITTGWAVTANITEDPGTLPHPEQLRIVINNTVPGFFPPLSEPTGGFPADLLTIKFEVQTFSEDDSTQLLFLRDETGFRRRDLDRLVLDGDTVDGNISFEPSPSEKITLDLPSIVIPIGQGETEGVAPLTIMGGYLDRDLVDIVFLTIEYDSLVVEVANPIADVVIDYDKFGIVPGQWIATPVVITNPDNPILLNANRLQITLQNFDPSNNPALSEPTGGFSADLLTIKFTAVSENPTDKTCLLFVDGVRSFFQKRDGTKLPVDGIGPECSEVPDGEVALPVVLSALGAIWHPNGTKIFWEAISQQGNLGWNIYRAETKDGKFVKINGELIKGAGTTANPMKYSFIDKDAEKGKVYYYYLEDISFNGEKHRTDPIKSIPLNKITSWGDIKRSALR